MRELEGASVRTTAGQHANAGHRGTVGDHWDDQRLLQAMGEGNVVAFEILYQRYARPVFSLAVRTLPTRTEAEALLEAVFVRLWATPVPAGLAAGSLGPWLLALTQCLATTWGQPATDGRPHAPLMLEATMDDPGVESTVAHWPGIAGEQQRLVLQDALSTLPMMERQVLEFAYFQHLRPCAIAEQLNMPVATVTTCLQQAMQTLKGRLLLAHRPSSPGAGHVPATVEERAVGEANWKW